MRTKLRSRIDKIARDFASEVLVALHGVSLGELAALHDRQVRGGGRTMKRSRARAAVVHRDVKPSNVALVTPKKRVTKPRRRRQRIADPRPSLLVGGRPRPRGWDEEE